MHQCPILPSFLLCPTQLPLANTSGQRNHCVVLEGSLQDALCDIQGSGKEICQKRADTPQQPAKASHPASDFSPAHVFQMFEIFLSVH